MAQRTTNLSAAIVTGHSRGLGAAIAAQLLERDVHVLGVARHGNAQLAARYGNALTEVELDLGDAPALAEWYQTGALGAHLHNAERAFLVNNAGVVQPFGPLQTQDIVTITRAAIVNVAAALALSAAFAAATQTARDRRILHISSGAGRHVYAGWSVYCASKAALDHHARAVALDHSPRLRISSVAPGVIDTDMQAEIRASTDEKVPDRRRFIEMKRRGELLTPEQAGRAVVEYLLSESFGAEPVTDLRYTNA
ncbi:MAG: SDR family oxidoreductase [Gemmatimonadaceae bacterium]